MSLLEPNYGRRGPPRNEHLYKMSVWFEHGQFRATLRNLKGPEAYYFTDLASLMEYISDVKMEDYEKDLDEGIIMYDYPAPEEENA
jgi:hypothetical protein